MNTQGQNIKESGIIGEEFIKNFIITETLLSKSNFFERNRFGYRSDLCGILKEKTFIIEIKCQAGHGGATERTLHLPRRISTQSSSDFALIILLGRETESKKGIEDWRNGWPQEIEEQIRTFMFMEEEQIKNQSELIYKNKKCFVNPKIKFFLINSPIKNIEEIKTKINEFVDFMSNI